MAGLVLIPVIYIHVTAVVCYGKVEHAYSSRRAVRAADHIIITINEERLNVVPLVWEIHGSHAGRNSAYFEVFLGLPQSIKSNTETLAQKDPELSSKMFSNLTFPVIFHSALIYTVDVASENKLGPVLDIFH
jgi:hypothetical protein